LGGAVFLAAAVGCGHKAAPSRHPQVAARPAPLVPLAPPSPVAALGAAAGMAVKVMAMAPCPPPNLPPEVASTLDCGAMKRFDDAAAYIPRQASSQLPAWVDLRAHGLSGPVRDQQQVGACAGFAMTTVMDNASLRMGRHEMLSSLHVFATYGDESDSMGFSAALRARPITAEQTWPYDPARACRFASDWTGQNCSSYYGVPNNSAKSDPRLIAEKQRADYLGRLQIVGYEELATDPADTDQLAMLVASGEALWLSLKFHGPAWKSLSRSGNNQLPYYPVEAAEISHAVTLEGYRHTPVGRQFLIHNSWGTDWAEGGYAWVDDAMMRSHVGLAYRVLVADASVPVPRPQPHCSYGRVPLLDICAPPPMSLPGVPGNWPRIPVAWTAPLHVIN
jgi:hypothetical protein